MIKYSEKTRSTAIDRSIDALIFLSFGNNCREERVYWEEKNAKDQEQTLT